MDRNITQKVGVYKSSGTAYTASVWSPKAEKIQMIIKGKPHPIDLEKDSYGYWQKEISELKEGDKYMFKLDGDKEIPDPSSLYQPGGVHSWSSVVDHSAYDWSGDNWQPPSMSDMVIYELHVGTFTPEGTFSAIIEKLDHLRDLGVNAIEIMPIAQFPGSRNWGYDGVYPFAVQESYGSVTDLKRLVEKCHQFGIAVILDVVYNHMGPEGNYLSLFGPYFTEKYNTPWGAALNFDDSYSDHVRNFFLQNAIMWLKDYHIDGLRLDAVHAIMDIGPTHFLKELSQKVDELEKETGRQYVLIAESDLNDVKLISDYDGGGYGLEGQWADDFHHAVHTLITGEGGGYYEDYGNLDHIAKSFQQGLIYDGIYSQHRKKKVGTDPSNNGKHQFVVCIQNHDQVGNRMLGDRLSQLVSLEKYKLAAGIMLISPFTPMLFMGEEYAEDQPFQYFVSHGDPDLVKAVQEGRKREFNSFKWEGEVPDPQSEATFNNSKLNWDFGNNKEKTTVFTFYKYLISLRKEGLLSSFRSDYFSISKDEDKNVLSVVAQKGGEEILAIMNFNATEQEVRIPAKNNEWNKLLASSDTRWQGPRDLPEKIEGGAVILLPSSSLILYK